MVNILPSLTVEGIMAERRIAISYSRFSDPKQAHGDSEDRQDRDFRHFCRRHNLTPLSEVYADRGRSGYKDEHRKKGKLGELIAAAKDGRFEVGTVIVVEAWDRLGRLRPDRQTELVAELLRTGVNIGVCRLNDVFTEEDFGTHKWAILSTFIMLAFQESKQKADRVAASWVRRRDRARENGKPMSARLPAWLEMASGEMRPIPARVAAVRRIFQLSADGYGQARILRTLTEEGFEPFGRGGKWSHSYVEKILNDRRVLGELQPRKGGEADGALIADYYPRVVEEDVFHLARAGQEGRGGRHGGRDRQYVNTFQGLLVNATDGEGFLVRNRGTTERPQLLLANSAGRDARAKTQTFPYLIFEEAILGLLREVNPDDVLPKEQAPSRATVLRAQLANIRQDIAGLKAELRKGFSKALADVLREREQDEEKTAGELQDELAASVRPAEKAWEQLPSLVDLIREHGDEARLKIRAVLRSIIQDARLLLVRRQSYILGAAQFHFTGGAVRHYLVVYRQACRLRPSGWQARSLADIADGADLRNCEDALAYEAELLEMDLAPLAE
jgi:DNA invertase Pin-like site-specific DNA recombinase